MCQFLCFSLPKHDSVELLLPEQRFYVQGSFIILNRLNKESYALHLSKLKDKSIFKRMKIVILSQFIPLIFFEKNLSTVALISPLKRQGARYLENQPIAGAALLFSFDNDDSSIAVLITVKRKEKENVPGNPNGEANNGNAVVDDDTVRDEDDFRKFYLTTKDAKKPHRLCGTNLTRYSMYGKFYADYRGYGNGNAALGAIVNILGGNEYPFRVSDDG